MYARFLSGYGHFKAGQCAELHDKFAAPLVPAIATPITASEYQKYIETMTAIDREVERRVSAMPARGGRREITNDQWWRDLGQHMPGYWKLADRHFRQQLESRK